MKCIQYTARPRPPTCAKFPIPNTPRSRSVLSWRNKPAIACEARADLAGGTGGRPAGRYPRAPMDGCSLRGFF